MTNKIDLDILESLEMFINDRNPPEDWYDSDGCLLSEYEDYFEEEDEEE